MAGYIGSKASITQVDGYNRTEADAEFVQVSGDTMTGNLDVNGTVKASGGFIFGNTNSYMYEGSDDTINFRVGENGPYVEFNDAGSGVLELGNAGGELALTSSGTERMRIDGSGRVTMPYQPVISGQIGTALISPSAPQLVAFNEFWTSVGITYNSTTRRFTVPVAGNYRITMNPFFRNAAPGARLLIGVNNDAPSAQNHYGHAYRESSQYETGCINSVVSLAANDYIVFYLQGGGLYNQSGDRFNQFSIQLIG